MNGSNAIVLEVFVEGVGVKLLNYAQVIFSRDRYEMSMEH